MKRIKINLDELPKDVFHQIVEYSVSKNIKEFSKISIKLLLNLSQISKEFYRIIHLFSNNWNILIQHQDKLPILNLYNYYTLTHTVLSRCFFCHKRCFTKRFNMVLHHECAMNLTQTCYYFDYRILKRNKVQDKLGKELCAIVDYYKLTPEIIKKNLPFIECQGYNRTMGSYTYDRFFVNPNNLFNKNDSLLGWLDINDSLLHMIKNKYKFKNSGLLKEIDEYQKIKAQKQKDIKRKEACNIRKVKLENSLKKLKLTIDDISTNSLGDYLDKTKLTTTTKISHIINIYK